MPERLRKNDSDRQQLKRAKWTARQVTHTKCPDRVISRTVLDPRCHLSAINRQMDTRKDSTHNLRVVWSTHKETARWATTPTTPIPPTPNKARSINNDNTSPNGPSSKVEWLLDGLLIAVPQ